jgi:hypothetical protein
VKLNLDALITFSLSRPVLENIRRAPDLTRRHGEHVVHKGVWLVWRSCRIPREFSTRDLLYSFGVISVVMFCTLFACRTCWCCAVRTPSSRTRGTWRASRLSKRLSVSFQINSIGSSFLAVSVSMVMDWTACCVVGSGVCAVPCSITASSSALVMVRKLANDFLESSLPASSQFLLALAPSSASPSSSIEAES